mmetsp:Transcript_16351/g.30964  ORF Transcript_16351/g.30964 Transcript_16351/m.30964 type:complete len:80 (-) Transcript_16351:1832-2071(-)
MYASNLESSFFTREMQCMVELKSKMEQGISWLSLPMKSYSSPGFKHLLYPSRDLLTCLDRVIEFLQIYIDQLRLSDLAT